GLGTSQCRRQPRLHCPEEPANTLRHLGVAAPQFHGGRHDETTSLSACAGGPLNISRKTRSEAFQRILTRGKLGIEARQGIGDISIERTQEKPVLIAKGGIEASSRKICRLEQLRKRSCVITGRPKNAHGAFYGFIHVELSRAATHPLRCLLYH